MQTPYTGIRTCLTDSRFRVDNLFAKYISTLSELPYGPLKFVKVDSGSRWFLMVINEQERLFW